MLPLFLRENGLSGQQIGIITGIGPVMTVLFQPIWGMIVDRWQAQRLVLYVTLPTAGVLALLYPQVGGYVMFLVLFAAMSTFHSSTIPIIDSISLRTVQQHGGDYGSLRLWGAIGFAVASMFAGRMADVTGLQAIFYIYAAAMFVCVLLTRSLPQESTRMEFQLLKGLGQLVRLPRFMVFLFGTFLIFGTIQANNSYYSIFFTAIGGNVAGVGLSFLIAAGSEAPVMKLAGRVISRTGLMWALVLSGLISALRWLFYGLEPAPMLVMSLLFVQGLSVGLFLPAAAQFVRDNTPTEIRVTALGIYSAIGNGLGSMAGTMVGGLLLDSVGIFGTYTVFGVASLVGVAAMFSLRFLPEKV
ncbi:PPP family 3-phenylpropionic acid transporter [Tumebacillus permanentifrigoris]|uniref:PPP family 3-phenylpropionic acid transporter n=2 Tax=Tumebacillus permanentifrigoris TaxID=378543 RepID=A0A316D4W6_9BACL|nr:PPP family 3-phenylpropionic acid transporter [Tumebacillus permanentifrigoris]